MAHAGLCGALIAPPRKFPMAWLQDYAPVIIALVAWLGGGAAFGPGAFLGAVNSRVNEGVGVLLQLFLVMFWDSVDLDLFVLLAFVGSSATVDLLDFLVFLRSAAHFYGGGFLAFVGGLVSLLTLVF